MRGVFGVCGKAKDCKSTLFTGAWDLQARGQKYCGIASADGGEKIKLRTHRGKVMQTFSDDLAGLEGYCGIASTSDFDRQPRPRNFKFGQFVICFDGYIKNADDLRRQMMTRGHSFETLEDVELIGAIIAEGVAQGVNIEDGIKRVFMMISGPCSLVLLTNEGVIYAAREPMGMQPLVLGKGRNKWAVASESAAFNDDAKLNLLRDVLPGEIIRIDRDNGIQTVGQVKGKQHICVFEYCYFGRGNSVMEGTEIAEARHNLGGLLAKRDQEMNSPAANADIVAAVLFSAWLHGEGYQLVSGKPFLAAFLPPQYSDRTYNITDVELRLLVRRLKHRTIKTNLKGKVVTLVDDSLRTAITMLGMVKDIRRAGAKEVHVRIASPPSTRNCPWALPPKEKEKYLAATKTVEEIRQKIGADTLDYLQIEDLPGAVGISADILCMDCFIKG